MQAVAHLRWQAEKGGKKGQHKVTVSLCYRSFLEELAKNKWNLVDSNETFWRTCKMLGVDIRRGSEWRPGPLEKGAQSLVPSAARKAESDSE